MNPTIKDIAEKCGVSYATVSRALSGHPYVKDETRERIIKIARQMGYRPNAVARGLVMRKTTTIGFMVPDITNPVFPEVARGLEDAALAAGYTVFLCNSNWDKDRELRIIDILLQQRVSGLVVFLCSEKSVDLIRRAKMDTKTVCISNMSHKSAMTLLYIDNELGARQAVEHLIERGHRAIACIGGLEDTAANRERLKGYHQALQNHGIAACSDFVRFGDYRLESGHAIMTELLRLPARPTAVFAANDLLALGAISAIKEHGLRVPEDVAVVGFDDIQLASLPEIQLSSISWPKYELGRIAFELVARCLEGEGPPEDRVLLQPTLVVRSTS